jgi:hypothetical protein
VTAPSSGKRPNSCRRLTDVDGLFAVMALEDGLVDFLTIPRIR